MLDHWVKQLYSLVQSVIDVRDASGATEGVWPDGVWTDGVWTDDAWAAWSSWANGAAEADGAAGSGGAATTGARDAEADGSSRIVAHGAEWRTANGQAGGRSWSQQRNRSN